MVVRRPTVAHVLGVIAYLLAAAVARWPPLVNMLILCVLPVFYGATSEGWSGTRSPRGEA